MGNWGLEVILKIAYKAFLLPKNNCLCMSEMCKVSKMYAKFEVFVDRDILIKSQSN
jgi:hypothetical protein